MYVCGRVLYVCVGRLDFIISIRYGPSKWCLTYQWTKCLNNFFAFGKQILLTSLHGVKKVFQNPAISMLPRIYVHIQEEERESERSCREPVSACPVSPENHTTNKHFQNYQKWSRFNGKYQHRRTSMFRYMVLSTKIDPDCFQIFRAISGTNGAGWWWHDGDGAVSDTA